MFEFNSLTDVVEKGMPIVKSPGAFMSPLQGAYGNPLSPTAEGRDFVVVAHVKINGFKFGMFVTNDASLPYPHKFQKARLSNNHAEDAFLSAFEQALFSSTSMLILCGLSLLFGKKVSLTMKSSKSPCPDCAAKLINFKRHFDSLVTLRIKTIRQYGGGKKVDREGATTNLANEGIPIMPLNLPAMTSSKHYGTNRYGHEHEYAALNYDPDSFTEKAFKNFLTDQITAFNKNDLELTNIIKNATPLSSNPTRDGVQTWYKTYESGRFDRVTLENNKEQILSMLNAIILDFKSGRHGAGNLLMSFGQELKTKARE